MRTDGDEIPFKKMLILKFKSYTYKNRKLRYISRLKIVDNLLILYVGGIYNYIVKVCYMFYIFL